MSNKKIITYSTDSEILVCTKATEQELIEYYFMKGGRSLDEYHRAETTGIVEIKTRLICSRG